MEQCRFLIFAVLLAWGFALAGHPYRITPALDIPLAAGATGAAAFGQYRLANMEPRAEPYDAADLFVWDRPFAGTWNPRAALASDWMSGLGAAPLVLGAVSWKKGKITGADFGTQALMLYEVLALQSGINLTVRSLRVWPRPFTLGGEGGEERSEGQAAGSFYSGHSSAAFAIAVFGSIWFGEVYPDSRWTPWVWAGSLTTATVVAALRVAAGKHYPSDVMVGAAVGSLIGWAVPALHRSTSSSSVEKTELPTPSAIARADNAWLRWHGVALSPDFVGWQCGF